MLKKWLLLASSVNSDLQENEESLGHCRRQMQFSPHVSFYFKEFFNTLITNYLTYVGTIRGLCVLGVLVSVLNNCVKISNCDTISAE